MTLAESAPEKVLADRPSSHLDFLDGLRGLAAIYVVMHHSWLTIWSDPKLFPTGWTGLLTRWLGFGHLAVTVFIVLSGFCLMLPVAKNGGNIRGGAKRFFTRRAHRIIPPYYFAILLCCILTATVIGNPNGGFWSQSIPHGTKAWIKGIITHVLLIDDVLDAHKINYVFWSVAVEWQIYFLFPVFVYLWRRSGPGLTTAAALLGSYAVAIAFNHHPRIRLVYPHYVGLFAVGMLGATAALGNYRAPIPWKTIGLLATAGAVGICLCGIESAITFTQLVDFFVGVATTCLLVASCRGEWIWPRAILSARPVVWVGMFSYSLYLIHAPLLQIIWQYMIHPLGLSEPATFALLIFAGGPMIVAVSYLFFLFCERPFLNRPQTGTAVRV